MKKIVIALVLIVVAIVGVQAFAKKTTQKSSDQKAMVSKAQLVIKIDGSSTVYPITEAVAEEYQKVDSSVKVTVGIAGSGGGFKKFCAGETDISDASRPIKTVEADACTAKAIEYIELPIGYDGLAIVVNPENTWLKNITVLELKKLWEPEAQKKVTKWNQVNPAWPNEEIHLFGPGTDSGTFDYFTEKIVGTQGKSRGDYTASEDDNVLVQGVSSDKYALGYFGVAYYEQNKDKLKLLGVDEEKGKGGLLPTYENVVKGAYHPLSRPLFVYVAVKSLEKPEVKGFVDYYLASAAKLVKEVSYIALPDADYPLVAKRFASKKTGSVFSTDAAKGLTVKEVLELE